MTPFLLSEEDFRRAFRRGRLLLWLVLGVTVAGVLPSTVSRVQFERWHGQTADAVGGLALVLLICGFAFRGGRLSTGLLMLCYGAKALTFCLSLVMLCCLIPVAIGLAVTLGFGHWWHQGFHTSVFPSASHPVTDHPAWMNFWSLVTGAWACFALWVLVFSKDVRLFREWRERGLRGAQEAHPQWRQLELPWSQ